MAFHRVDPVEFAARSGNVSAVNHGNPCRFLGGHDEGNGRNI